MKQTKDRGFTDFFLDLDELLGGEALAEKIPLYIFGGAAAEKYPINPDKLIAYYKSARQYYVGNLRTLDTTFNIVLKEYFGLKPRSFA